MAAQPAPLCQKRRRPGRSPATGLGKLMIEQALAFVGRTRGLAYNVLRVSNAVGRWQNNDAQGIVSIALRAA